MSPCIFKYVSDLPYKPRLELCNILDYNHDWKTLGGTYLKYNNYVLFQMENAIIRRGSPTDEMLSRAGAANLTMVELFNYLRCMRHYRAMLVLKPHVDKKYHSWIPDDCIESQTVEPTPVPRERCVFSEDNIKTAQPNVQARNLLPEASVKQENTPRNQNNEATRKVSDPVTPLNVVGGTPHIPYEELTVATNNWDRMNILGKGGFGTVYKGFWKNTPVAVKKLEVMRSNKSEETLNQCQREQSLRELKYLNSCRHDNILPLYGISFESGKYCLVYQFMPNGSLEDRLLMKRGTPILLWSERLNIAKGTALGLQFLHSREPPLIHGDIKSANILLNSHLDPVIGDFGLTQEGPIEKATHITLKRVNGTRPYLPYEFLSAKRLSTKVDVYGFGIVLFELATGMRAWDETRRSERLLKSLVDKQPDESFHEIADKNCQPQDLNIVNAFFKIGKVSTKNLAKDRPEMLQVYSMLCGSAENSIATGSRPTQPMPSETPGRSRLPPNNLPPRYKFKTQDPATPYLPPPIMNAPHLLQQNSSPYLHPLLRAQQTGSQNILPQSQQGHLIRPAHPSDLPPRVSLPQQQGTNHMMQTPSNIANINAMSAMGNHIPSRSPVPGSSPNINAYPTNMTNMPANINAYPTNMTNMPANINAAFTLSPRPVTNMNEFPNPASNVNLPVLPNTMPPIAKIDKTIPEASHSQEDCSTDCSGNHSSTDSEGSLEILDDKFEEELEKSALSIQALPLFLKDPNSASPEAHESNTKPTQESHITSVTQDNNRSGVDIVSVTAIPLLQYLNINR